MLVILNEENFFIRYAEEGEQGAVDTPYIYGIASQHKLVNGQWTFDPNVLTTSDIAAAEERLLKSKWKPIRIQRDKELLKCDWTQLPDVPIPMKEAWAVYRQALRDITLQEDPDNIIWPIPPNAS